MVTADNPVRYLVKWSVGGKPTHEVCHLQARAAQRASQLSREKADDNRVQIVRQEWHADGRYWRDLQTFVVIDGHVHQQKEAKPV